MKDNTSLVPIEDHLKDFQSFVCGFLGKALPPICMEGSDWWMLLVRSVPHLKGAQASRIKSGSIRELGKLDLVSLCGVLKHNWRTICERQGIEDQQRVGALQCDTLINLRNTLSHLGTENTLTLEDSLAALLSIKKLGQLLGAPASLVKSLDTDLKAINRILSGAGDPPPPSEVEKNTPGRVEAMGDRPLAPRRDQGISLSVLACEGETREEVEAALSLATYIGIDFGTSTTIASRVFLDPVKGVLTTEPIPIPQMDRLGRTIEDHLVPSCVAWYEEKLLIGHGAAEIKTELSREVDV